MMTEHWENLNALTAPLLTWYDLNGRTLPWRSVVTPYRTGSRRSCSSRRA
ncbi:MAG: hypothetical protein ACLRSD_08150 [Oscillibacter sp.]